jgi:hypothetical protein
MRSVQKQYLREFFPSLIGYVVLLCLSLTWLKTLEGTAARAVVTLAPVVPIAFLIRAMVRAIRNQDELERRIDLESLAIALGIGGFGFCTYGFLLRASVLPDPSGVVIAIWVLPVLLSCFGLVKIAVRRYYRAV